MAQKFTLPPVNLDLTLERGKMKAITEAATGKGAEYIMPVDQIRVIPGFNVRITETEAYRSALDALKQSIRENGYYPNKALAGYIGKDGNDDVLYVTDGHRRLQAVNEINAEALDASEEIVGLPVVLKPADSSVADLTIALVQDNSGQPLTPYEMGVVVSRLQGMTDDLGNPLFSKSEIAKKLSITERYIDDLDLLVSAPAKVRNHVLGGAVSATLAIQELRRDPKAAADRIDTAVTKAKSSGKARATKKDVGGIRMQKVRATVSMATGTPMGEVLKTLAKEIRDAVPHAGKDDGDGLLVDGTLTVIMEIPAPEKPAKEKAAKKTAPKKSAAKGNTRKGKAAAAEATSENESSAEVASNADEGEPVKLPPKVPTVDSRDDPDDI